MAPAMTARDEMIAADPRTEEIVPVALAGQPAVRRIRAPPRSASRRGHGRVTVGASAPVVVGSAAVGPTLRGARGLPDRIGRSTVGRVLAHVPAGRFGNRAPGRSAVSGATAPVVPGIVAVSRAARGFRQGRRGATTPVATRTGHSAMTQVRTGSAGPAATAVTTARRGTAGLPGAVRAAAAARIQRWAAGRAGRDPPGILGTRRQETARETGQAVPSGPRIGPTASTTGPDTGRSGATRQRPADRRAAQPPGPTARAPHAAARRIADPTVRPVCGRVEGPRLAGPVRSATGLPRRAPVPGQRAGNTVAQRPAVTGAQTNDAGTRGVAGARIGRCRHRRRSGPSPNRR